MAEELLLEIEMPSDEVELAYQRMGNLQKRIDELKASQKELAQTQGKGSAAYQKNAVEVKRLSGELRKNQKVVMDNRNAQKAAEGSVSQLREQLKVASKQWADLSEEERENGEEGKRLAKVKTDLTAKLKEVESATGDNRRNVGNYKDSLKEAAAESGLFGRAQQGLASGQAAVTTATKAATAATQSWKAALISTGIGALIVALGSLIGFLATLRGSIARNEESQAKLNKIMGLFRGLINGVLKVMEPLANTVLDKAAKGFDMVAKAASKASKLVQQALEFFGFDEQAQKLKNFTDTVGETVKAQQELALAEQELAEIRRKQDKTQLDYQKRAEELRQIRDNTDKSTQERIEANRKLGDLLDEQFDKELAMANKALEIAQLRVKAEGETEENLNAVAEAELKISEIEERIVSQRSEQLTNANAIRKEQSEAAQAQIEQEKQAELDAINEIDQAKDEALEREKERMKEQGEMYEISARKQINALKRQLLEGKITREQYNEELEDLELAHLMVRKNLLKEAGKDITAIEQRILDKKIEMKGQEQQVNKLTTDQKVGLANQALGNLKSIFNEESAAYKAIGIAQATIDTYKAANKALTAGPIIGPILAATTVAAGLANVAKIVSTDAGNNFADGVIGLQGPGTEKSDSISANLSKGESVMTAKATNTFAPVLAQMEAMVGNKPNYQLGSRKFSRGIINAGSNAGLDNARRANNDAMQFKDAIERTKVFVSLTELREEQRRFSSATNKASIVD